MVISLFGIVNDYEFFVYPILREPAGGFNEGFPSHRDRHTLAVLKTAESAIRVARKRPRSRRQESENPFSCRDTRNHGIRQGMWYKKEIHVFFKCVQIFKVHLPDRKDDVRRQKRLDQFRREFSCIDSVPGATRHHPEAASNRLNVFSKNRQFQDSMQVVHRCVFTKLAVSGHEDKTDMWIQQHLVEDKSQSENGFSVVVKENRHGDWFLRSDNPLHITVKRINGEDSVVKRSHSFQEIFRNCFFFLVVHFLVGHVLQGLETMEQTQESPAKGKAIFLKGGGNIVCF